MKRADLGDHVRIVATSLTEELGLSGQVGTCYGFTTPSITGVLVLGDTPEDVALSVSFDRADSTWFAPDLVELVDHGAGTVATLGDKTFVRNAEGEWIESPPTR